MLETIYTLYVVPDVTETADYRVCKQMLLLATAVGIILRCCSPTTAARGWRLKLWYHCYGIYG